MSSVSLEQLSLLSLWRKEYGLDRRPKPKSQSAHGETEQIRRLLTDTPPSRTARESGAPNLWKVKSVYQNGNRGGPPGPINLLVSSTARFGEMLFAAGSVDKSGTYVFEVHCNGLGRRSKTLFGEWNISGDNDTMINLWNWTDHDQDVILRLYYSGGHYDYPVHLPQRESLMFNIKEVLASETADASQTVVPSSVQFGTAVLSGIDGSDINIGVSYGIFNVKSATCRDRCGQCNVSTDFYVQPGDGFTILTGDQITFQAFADFQDGSEVLEDNAAWNSTNSNVASSNGVYNGSFKANAPGIFSAEAQAGLEDGSCDDAERYCTYPPQFAASTGNVLPTISSISVTQGLIGTTIHNITIQGNGLSGGTVDAGTGITATVTSSTSTQIQADFAIGSTASAGNHVVSVAVNGQSTYADLSFYVQIPSRLTINSIQAPVLVNNQSVFDFYGNLVRTNECGIYRDVQYNLVDQAGNNIIGGDFDLTENFSNYSTSNPNTTKPPSQTFVQNTSVQLLADTQGYISPSPACPGQNDHEGFDQTFVITVPSQSASHYPLSTVVHVDRGGYSGTGKVDISITTP